MMAHTAAVQAVMRYVLPIVSLLVTVLSLASAATARAGETDCDELQLRVRLDEYLPTWCYYSYSTDGDARARFEAMFVEGTTSYAMVVFARAGSLTYLPRQSLESLVIELLDESDQVSWREGIGLEGYTVKRFATIENSGRETNCVAFNRNDPAPNGRPRTRLYGYICHAGRGEIADDNLATFIAAIDE